MKSKKKNSLLFEYRHCFAFMTVLVMLFVALLPFASSANTAEYASTNIGQYYQLIDAFYSFDKDTVLLNSDGFTTSNITTTWSAITNQFPAYLNYFNGGVNYSFRVINSISLDANLGGATVDFSNTPYHSYGVFSSDQGNTQSYAFLGAGQFANIFYNNHWWVVSDSAFKVGWSTNSSSSSTMGITDVSTVSSNGFYCTNITDGMRFGFSDFPIYIPSTDGSSGFTNFTLNSTDFEFSAENYDFNYVLRDGLIDNPNAPSEQEDERIKYNITFRDSTYYSGEGLNTLRHNNNFTFTEFQINNPVNYRLHFTYRVEFSNNLGVDSVFYYTPTSDIQLAYFMGQSSRLGTGSRVSVPLCSDWFIDGQNRTLTSVIRDTITAVTGTETGYVNPNGLFENIIDWIVTDYNYFWGSDGSPLQYVKSVYNGVVTKFTIYGEVSLYDVNNSNYESYSYKDYHDFMTNHGGVISTDNTIPPYDESPVPIYTDFPVSNGSGGGTVSGGGSGGVFNDGDVTLVVNDNAPWTPYTLDEVSYANVKNMFEDIRDFIDSTSQNSFWQVLRVTFGYIPDPIWNYITITIAVICGFAVVRYVLRR